MDDMDAIGITFRVDTVNAFELMNPVLMLNEIGIIKPDGRWKIGDGKTPWRELPWHAEPRLQFI